MISSPQLPVGAVQLDHYSRNDCGCCNEFGFGDAVISPQLSKCGITTDDIDKELDKLKAIEKENASILRSCCVGTCVLVVVSFATVALSVVSLIRDSKNDHDDWNDMTFDEKKASMDDDSGGPSLGQLLPFIAFGVLAVVMGGIHCMMQQTYYNTILPAWRNCIQEINSQAPWVSAGITWEIRETAELYQSGDDTKVKRSYILIIAPPTGNVAYTNTAPTRPAPPAYPKRPQAPPQRPTRPPPSQTQGGATSDEGQEAGQVEVAVNFCGHCGKKLNPNFKFCRSCGAPVDAEMLV